MRQVVMLRGINLGPRNRIAMAELRELFSGAGFAEVRTYVQSGNVVLGSDSPPDELGADCERLIADRFGLAIDVIARTQAELAAVVRRDPLGEVAVDPKRYQVSFMSAELDPAVVSELEALVAGPERFVVAGSECYAWHPDGVARSKLWNRLAAKQLGVKATARNWTTVTTLLAMAEE
jgi:uncharacterized protein (DUF1697 family)